MDKSNYRYERKFFISELSDKEVEAIVKLHPALFSEIYHQRFVNNIYYDFLDLSNFYDNIDGVTNRIKFRIRWYGETFNVIKKPILELKIKNGLLGKKVSYLLRPFKIDRYINFQTISDSINRSDIPEIIKIKLKSSIPILLNHYTRKYFQSANRLYRITIDTYQIFYQINSQNISFSNKSKDDMNVILELKYDQDCETNANFITNYFPFRMTKSSKYVRGIYDLYY